MKLPHPMRRHKHPAPGLQPPAACMAVGRSRHRQLPALQLHPAPAVFFALLLVSICSSHHAAALPVQIPVDDYCQEPGHGSCSVCQQPIIIDNRNPCSVGAVLLASTGFRSP